MPAARLHALKLLLSLDTATTPQIATELGLPTSTARRVLEDVTAHGLSSRESQGEGKADRWRIEPWVADNYRAATVPEMSDAPIYRTPHTTFDDKTGTVTR